LEGLKPQPLTNLLALIATIEEQSATSNEIANNISQASLGIQDVNENVNQSSTVAGSISGDISEVSLSVQEITKSSGEDQLCGNENPRHQGVYNIVTDIFLNLFTFSKFFC
jgi:hypothetical protein